MEKMKQILTIESLKKANWKFTKVKTLESGSNVILVETSSGNTYQVLTTKLVNKDNFEKCALQETEEGWLIGPIEDGEEW